MEDGNNAVFSTGGGGDMDDAVFGKAEGEGERESVGHEIPSHVLRSVCLVLMGKTGQNFKYILSSGVNSNTFVQHLKDREG